MIEPTDRLCEAAAPYSAKLIFFVDTTYLLRLQSMAAKVNSCARDFSAVRGQLVDLVQAGHCVLPHLHPHWIDAAYLAERNEWCLEKSERYRFSSLQASERANLFKASMELLSDMLGSKESAFQIDGYRAGGWCIQPFSDFKPCFERHGIVADFSVIPGRLHNSSTRQFDFSWVHNVTPYRFTEDPCIPDPSGRFVELPISSLDLPPMYCVVDRIVRTFHHRVVRDHTFGRGSGLVVSQSASAPASKGLSYGLDEGRSRVFAIESLNAATLPLYRRALRSRPYLHFNSHPKMIANHNVRAFSAFLRYAFHEYEVNTDYRAYLGI